jgi:Transcriptional regulator, AbiEi antitoxin
VHRRQDVSDRLLQLAAMQACVVTRDQALGHGLSRHSIGRLVESGAWRRLARGLFLTVPLEPSWDSLAWAGVLLGGQFARLGPESSGFLHQPLPQPPDPLDVLVPRERRVGVLGPWHFIREAPGVRAARSVKDPPRLTVESTVLELADVRDAGEVVGLITTAVQRRRTTVRRLRRELDERARHRHRALLRDLLSDVEVGAESPIELRYLRDVERPHGLPKGNRQQSRSGLPYQTDVDYEEFRLIVELDGRVDHDGVGRFRDMDRDNRHALVEAVTLRYGSYDLAARPCGTVHHGGLLLRRLQELAGAATCRISGENASDEGVGRANSLSECQSNWPSRSTGHWPLADTSKPSSGAGAVALVRSMTCSLPDHNE